MHKPLFHHSGAQGSFPCGDYAVTQMAEQRTIKAALCVSIVAPPSGPLHEPQKPRDKTIGSPSNLPHKW